MPGLADPGVTVALALAAGVVAQSTARHLALPGIVLLLVLGVVLGPDGVGLILPATLGNGLETLVGFAVAVILFEGGMNLDLARLRREQKAIRRLVTLGALTTAAGGTLIAKYTLGWDWRTSVVFGTLVIVTGPTVVNPLLRQLRVERSVATILEAEGVLSDAIGTIAAAVALEIALHPTGERVAFGPLDLFVKLIFGLGIGGIAGWGVGWLLKFRKVVPEGHENVFILAIVLALFQVSNALLEETGIPAVIAAGVVVGNWRGLRIQRELFEFKEQLTVMLIGLLFILLAADVRLRDVYSLGTRGALAVGALLFLLRPLAVFVSTWGSEVSLRQKLFMSWIGPRGVVAAAIASLFAVRLSEQDYAGGAELRALVFAVVAVSVLSAGVLGGLVGRWLEVRHTPAGWVVLGANPVAREVALSLQNAGEDVVCIDRDATCCRAAEEVGVSTLCGNGLDEAMMLRAGIEHRRGALAITPNDEVNYLFVKRVTEAARLGTLAAVVDHNRRGVAVDVGSDQGSDVLFGGPQDVQHWCDRLEGSTAVSERWCLVRRRQPMALVQKELPATLALFLAIRRQESVFPVTYSTRFRRGDIARVLQHTQSLAESRAALTRLGWVPETG